MAKRSGSKEKRSGRKRRSATPAGAPRARKKAAAADTLPLFERPAAGDAPAQTAPASRGKKGSAEPAPPTARGGGSARARPRAFQTAQTIAQRQREISVSEFFAKNRHLLGFDSPSRAILTAVKEAVDNSLDACEEAGILPDLSVQISELSETRYRVVVEDSGPGIVKAQVPKIFGKLLYGSKFHQLKQSRGQQGIGISAAVMYAQLTTGKAVKVTTRVSPKQRAHLYELQIDTKKNTPVVLDDGEVDWDRPHGTRVDMEIEATYKKGRYSVDTHIHQTALANPHAEIHFVPPKGDPIHYKRLTAAMPSEPVAIKPHPHGVELGVLLEMMQATKARSLAAFFGSEFSRMSPKTTHDVLHQAGIAPRTNPKRISREQAEKLIAAFAGAKIMKPPTNCLSAVGEELLVKSLEREFPASFYAAVTRPPAVYRGNPFQIEAALAYGVEGMPADELVELYRFANRAPLVYQQSACAITRAVVSTAWKGYGLGQGKGALPTGPMVVMVQIESVWVPFTSESKEAIAHYPEIIKEIKLALQECGRQLARFIRKGERAREEEKKRSYIEQYIPHIGIALQEILGLSEKEEGRVVTRLKDTLEKSRKH